MQGNEVFDCILDAEEDEDFWKEDTYDEMRLVWYNYTLGNWKALVAIPALSLYWEVTYDKEKEAVYVDRYTKTAQNVLYDENEEMGG